MRAASASASTVAVRGRSAARKPVIAGVAVTPRRCGAEERRDPVRRRHARARAVRRPTRKKVLHAKTRRGRLRGRAGHRPERPGLDQGAEGRGDHRSRPVAYPPTETDLIGPLTAAGAATADIVIPGTDANGCVNMANALTQIGVTDPKKIVANPLCLNAQVISALGDFPKWTYGIASSLFGDSTDPGRRAVREGHEGSSATSTNAPDPWNIVNFGTMLSTIRFLNDGRNGSTTATWRRSRRRGVLRQRQGVQGPAGARRPVARLRHAQGRPGGLQRPRTVLHLPGEGRVREVGRLAAAARSERCSARRP